MLVSLLRIGNSQGVIIPKPLLAQAGLSHDVEMLLENESIVLRKPARSVRNGWAKASAALAARGDDVLVWPEVGNEDDVAIEW